MAALEPPRPATAGGRWIATLVLAALACNLAASIQPMATLRVLALAGACLAVFCWCALRPEGADPAAQAGSGSASAARLVLPAVALAGTLLALHGLYQVAFGFEQLERAAGPEVADALRARLASRRAAAGLGLPAALGGWLAMALPVTLGWALRAGRSSPARWIGLAAALIQAAGLAATRSAGAIGALVLAAVAVAVSQTTGPASGGSGRSRLRAAAAVAAGAILVAALLWARTSAARAPDEGTGPVALRAGNWRVALQIGAGSPALGAGLGCYGAAFPAHRSWEMNESRFAHNSFLQVGAEGGLFLGILAAWLACALGLRLLRAAGREGGRSGAWLAVSCLSFLLHNLVDFTLYLPSVGLLFFVLAGLAVSRLRKSAAPPAGPLARAAALAGALALALFAVATTRADQSLQRARDLVLAGDNAGALADARRAARLSPLDPEPPSFLSNLLLAEAGRSRSPEALEEASRLARRAIAIDPRGARHHAQLGRVLLARGDLVGAYLRLDRATALHPTRIEYRRERDAVAGALARAAR